MADPQNGRKYFQIISLIRDLYLDYINKELLQFVLVWATVINYHRLGGLANNYLFLIVLESPRSMCPQVWCLKALFLVCRWLFSYVLT